MPDLLIRNLPENLKKDIARRARKSGKSLSDEAKHLLKKAVKNSGEKLPLGVALRKTFADVGYANLELPPRAENPDNPFRK